MEILLLPFAGVLAGIVSFSSPCCLPLVPGYLSYVPALPVSDLGRRDARRATLRASLLFVAGGVRDADLERLLIEATGGNSDGQAR